MGTWGEGLWDNDGALDALAELIAFDASAVTTSGELAGWMGLRAWFGESALEVEPEPFLALLSAKAELVAALPDDAREGLRRMMEDREALPRGLRTKEAAWAIGGYCDGPRVEALLRCAGAEAVMATVGERCARMLDATLGRADADLYEIAAGMGALGVLVEFALAGFWRPEPARLAAWRAGFAAADKRTKSERGFWWKYVSNAKRGFGLVAG